jgi:hypothetical protein
MSSIRNFPATLAVASATIFWPGLATASDWTIGPPTILAAASTSLAGLLAVALIAIFRIRQHLRAEKARNEEISGRATLMRAVSSLRSEHTIIWPFNSNDEIVSEGFSDMLGIESPPDGMLAAMLELLPDEDAETLRNAVDDLRSKRIAFSLQVFSADRARNFSVRGDCIVFV